jgi:spore maturation protein CgeB
MHVFTAVRHSNDPVYYYGGLWSANFYPALRELGHTIVESQIDLLPTSRFMHIEDRFNPQELEARAQTTQKIIDEVVQAHKQRPIDVFLSYFYNAHFDPAGFAELRRLGIPTVNFYCNSMYQFAHVAQVASAVDFSWHTERAARPYYVAVGARPVWVQLGADPVLYRPVPVEARQAKVCFVGQRYADRDRWLAALIKAEIPLAIYGSGWEADRGQSSESSSEPNYLGRRQFKPGSLSSYVKVVGETLRRQGVLNGLGRIALLWQYRNESQKLQTILRPYANGRAGDLSTIFSRYEVCLNMSNVWADGRVGSALIPHLRLRDFEAPMCGACYLTGYSEEIEEFYKIGKEIDTYETEYELVDKALYYLNRREKAEALRQAGLKRARCDHTWKRRFEELFRAVDFGRKSTVAL